MNKDPKISVIINCYNGEKYLKDAIDSVYAQTFKDWEIIFIDNCSTDNTAKIAQSYDERVKYHKTKKTIKLYAARNYAMKFVKGKYVSFLDSDDMWLSEKLEKQLNCFSDQIALVCTLLHFIDSNGNKINKSDPPKYRGLVTNKLLTRNFVGISSVMARTNILKKHQFNSGYNLFGDHDMWIRLSSHHEFDYVNEFLTIVRLRPDSTTHTERFNWIYERRDSIKRFYLENGLKYPSILLFILRAEISNILTRIRN